MSQKIPGFPYDLKSLYLDLLGKITFKFKTKMDSVAYRANTSF